MILSQQKASSCRSFLSLDLGFASVNYNETFSSRGSHQPIYFSNTYTTGVSNALTNKWPSTYTDRYIGVYKWRPGEVVPAKAQEQPQIYNEIVSQLFEEWRKQHPEYKGVDEIADLERAYEWRRKSFLTFSIDGKYFGGARLFDGLKKIKLMNEAGRPSVVSLQGETEGEPVRLPVEIRFPEVVITGKKIEIGLMTSRTEVNESMGAIFYKLAQFILEKYGSGKYIKVETDLPQWVESEELGRVNIGDLNTQLMVTRYGPNVDYSQKVTYYEFEADEVQSLEELKDLYIYFLVNSRMTKFYERIAPEVETVQMLSSETGAPLNLLRISASDFIKRYFFENKHLQPTLNHRAKDLEVFQQAEIRRRWEEVKRKRAKRIYKEKVTQILAESYPGEDPDNFDVTILGDFLNPEAALEVIIKPKPGTKEWHNSFFAPVGDLYSP